MSGASLLAVAVASAGGLLKARAGEIPGLLARRPLAGVRADAVGRVVKRVSLRSQGHLAANRFRGRSSGGHAGPRPLASAQRQLEEFHADEQYGGDAGGDEPVSSR